MPRANPLQAAFNAGELGPRMAGRVDFAKYRSAGARVENMTPLPQGGLTRRPGTRFVAAAADHGKRPRLIPFEFSTEQAYVLESGDRTLRFFRNKGQIVVEPTDAAVANGNFSSDLTGWGEVSTGSASIEHQYLSSTKIGTLNKAQIVDQYWGDTTANRRHFGLRFTATTAGEIVRSRIVVASTSNLIAFDAVAKLYSDDGGSPGVQVGPDSDTVTINAAGVFTFNFGAPPAVAEGITYWMIFAHEAGGDGRARVSLASDQPGFGSGAADDITLIGDATNLSASYEIRGEVEVSTTTTNSALALVGNGTDIAAAE